MPRPDTIPEDDPVTLKEACEIVFRNTVGPGTLLAAAARGQITISRIGRRNFTTLREARSLLASCRVESNRLAYTSTRPAGNGLSETDQVSSAQAALKATLGRLKSNSPRT
jgi:hypothetical protein